MEHKRDGTGRGSGLRGGTQRGGACRSEMVYGVVGHTYKAYMNRR